MRFGITRRRHSITANRGLVSIAAALGACLLAAAPRAEAANPVFQDFFFDICDNPTGPLLDRCMEWTGPQADLSGDSESSMNPSQILSNNDTPLARAMNYAARVRNGDEDPVEQEPEAGAALQFGKFSLLFQIRTSSYETDKIADVDAERSFDGNYYGAELGFRYRTTRGFVSLNLSFDSSDQDFVGNNPGVNFEPEPTAGKTESDSVSLSVVGGASLTDTLTFAGGVGYGTSQYNFFRNAILQDSTRNLDTTRYVKTEADVDGDQAWASLNLAFNFGQERATFGPTIGITYATSSIDPYTETEISETPWGLAMSYGSTERDSVVAHTGFGAQFNRSTSTGVMSTFVRVVYEHEYDYDPDRVVSTYVLDLNNNQFQLLGDEPDRDRFHIGFGLSKEMRGGWRPYFDIDVLAGDKYIDHRYRLAAGFRKEMRRGS
jgi:hypothetical protein